MFNGLMENIEWFFNLHDKNKDGYLTKDEVLVLSETWLVSAQAMHILDCPGVFDALGFQYFGTPFVAHLYGSTSDREPFPDFYAFRCSAGCALNFVQVYL